MQHEHFHGPVTALAFFQHDIVLAGEGTHLLAYDVKTGDLVHREPIFEQQAIHGLIVDDRSPATVLVRGGHLIRILLIERTQDGFSVQCGSIQGPHDWILDAAFAPRVAGATPLAAIVTAHNALHMAKISNLGSEDSFVLEHLVRGSNCILYSAHVKWLSAWHCLVAAGTAFGDIILWSATLNEEDGCFDVQSQTHYTFPAHEGSVFGVCLSPPITVPGSNDNRRLLASCSDDRTVRLWDVTDLNVESPTLQQVQTDTGFGSKHQDHAHAPPCLARVMGHVSRIWHVRFLPGVQSDGAHFKLPSLCILSFGEDASRITWHVKCSNPAQKPTNYSLEQIHVETAHSGKNIWSVALDEGDPGCLATGGADGAISIRPPRPNVDSGAEIARDLLGQSDQVDNFRSYCFVDSHTLVSATDRGCVVVVKLAHEVSQFSVEKVSEPLPGLKGYSIAAGVPGAAFVGGVDGAVHYHDLKSNNLSHLFSATRKIAGLFAKRIDCNTVTLVITGVGAGRADLLVLKLHESQPLHDDRLALRCIWPLRLPSSFVVTSFECTDSLAMLGSRNGSVAIVGLPQHDSSDELGYLSLYELVHSNEAVTSLHWHRREACNKRRDWLFSTGRDGTLAVHEVKSLASRVQLERVHQLALPLGPNVEGMSIIPEGQLRVWGFRSKIFVVYDLLAQREVMKVECGGAHRNWAFEPAPDGGQYVWTKASRVYTTTQHQSPYMLMHSGSHGREIKAVAISPPCLGKQIIATGAEDTDIKLFTLQGERLRCLQTLRKHNTGVQHLQWSADGTYLFSSGGFEEFFVWNLHLEVPGLGAGVFCESTHPRSGSSDLRIMGFVQREADPGVSLVHMAYSDSTLKLWRYRHSSSWTLVASGDYLTASLTHSIGVRNRDGTMITAASDGHVAHWRHEKGERLVWLHRHQIHQNAILSIAAIPDLGDDTSLLVTGGDDNALALTRTTPDRRPHTLRISRAHAAAVTGVALVRVSETVHWVVSAGIDQRVKLWEVNVAVDKPGVEGVEVRKLQEASTPVADVSGIETCRLRDGGLGVVVCGVGMDVRRLPVPILAAEEGKGDA